MDKEALIETLFDWNFWKRDIDCGIQRKTYLDKIIRFIKTGQILSIVGARRSGKSTLMLQYARHLIDSGVPKENILFVNFEEPRFLGELSINFLQKIYETYLEYLDPKGKIYLFLDEIQNVPAWEKFVRSFHEMKKGSIIISGSSSKLLSSEFGTVLTGRHLSIEVFPLNFKEFLYFRGINIEKRLEKASNKIKIRRSFTEYISYGGFPKVVLADEKREILMRYFEDIIARDVIERKRIKKTLKLKELAKFYLTNIASINSFNKMRRILSMPLDTVERYSYYLAESYLVFFTKKFSYKLKEQELNPRKAYCIDIGLRNAIGFRMSRDMGKVFENIVFLELKKDNREIFYSRDKYECDFLVKRDEKIVQAIQVCYDYNENTSKRELRGLIEAMLKFKLKEGIIITNDYKGEQTIKKDRKKIRIKYIPLLDWII